MEYLEHITSNSGTSVYQIIGGNDFSKIKRYVVSTPSTRLVTTDANIRGEPYERVLQEGMRDAFLNLPEREQLEQIPDTKFNILNILTGSEAWEVRAALNDAYGFENCCKSFIWSKRDYDDKKGWHTEIKGTKIYVGNDMTLVSADIVATGVSLETALEEVTKEFEGKGSLDNLVFITIGGEETEKRIGKYFPEISDKNPNFKEAIIVYLEGRFLVADKSTDVLIKDEGTDLLAIDSLVAPEFLIEDYRDIKFTLEKCRAYYGSRRVAGTLEHLEEVRDYWRELLSKANEVSLYDALYERSLIKLDMDFGRAIDKNWKGLDKNTKNTLWYAHINRWTPEFIQYSQTPEALEEVCISRINELTKLIGD